MSTLNLHVSKNKKTGKRSIEVAEITFQHKGKKIQIYMAHHVQVEIDNVKCKRTFERSVPLLQILYFIIDEVEKV